MRKREGRQVQNDRGQEGGRQKGSKNKLAAFAFLKGGVGYSLK